MDESAATVPEKFTCEVGYGGNAYCGIETHYLASYGGGDATPLCMGHLMVEIEQSYRDTGYQQQEWVITYQ